MRGRTLILAYLLAAVAMLAPATSGAGQLQRFYDAKKKATSPEAWRRCRDRLAKVEVGTGEVAFLAAVEMQVLAHRGKPADALLEGHLREASERANAAERESGVRHLVFGFVRDDREHPRFEVLLRDHRVIRAGPLDGEAGAPLGPALTSSKPRFEAAKKDSTTPAAFERARRRAAGVTAGMAELEFLDAMQMQVLAPRGKPIDGFIDGYLPEASRMAAEADTDRTRRHLVFGYMLDGAEHPRLAVVLDDQAVVEVQDLPRH